MDELFEIIKNYNAGEVIILLVLVFVSVEFIISKIKKIVDWSKAKKKEYHETESEKEEKEETIDDRITRLESNDQMQNQKIEEIQNTLTVNGGVLVEIKKSQDAVTMATCKHTLVNLHEEYMKQGYVTQDQLDTFLGIGDVYESAGGNGTYHLKLKPDILNLPLK